MMDVHPSSSSIAQSSLLIKPKPRFQIVRNPPNLQKGHGMSDPEFKRVELQVADDAELPPLSARRVGEDEEEEEEGLAVEPEPVDRPHAAMSEDVAMPLPAEVSALANRDSSRGGSMDGSGYGGRQSSGDYRESSGRGGTGYPQQQQQRPLPMLGQREPFNSRQGSSGAGGDWRQSGGPSRGMVDSRRERSPPSSQQQQPWSGGYPPRGGRPQTTGPIRQRSPPRMPQPQQPQSQRGFDDRRGMDYGRGAGGGQPPAMRLGGGRFDDHGRQDVKRGPPPMLQGSSGEFPPAKRHRSAPRGAQGGDIQQYRLGADSRGPANHQPLLPLRRRSPPRGN